MLTLNPEEGREAKKASFSSFLVSGLAQISPPPSPVELAVERVNEFRPILPRMRPREANKAVAVRNEKGTSVFSLSPLPSTIRPQRFLSFFARSLLRHTLRFPRSRDKPLRSASRVFFRLGNLTTPDCLSV